MSRLRRPFLSDRYFFLTVNLCSGAGTIRGKGIRRVARVEQRAP